MARLGDVPCERERIWVERIRDGDEEAFRSLFNHYYEPLCDFVERQIGSTPDVEDLVQQIFVKIWQVHADWSLRGSLRAYLFAAARYKVVNYWRDLSFDRKIVQRVSETWLNEVKSESNPEDALRQKELTGDLSRVLDSLPERRRLVYLLSRYYGLSYGEIARALGISIKTVETQMGRALKTFRDSLVRNLVVLFSTIL